MTYLEWGDPVSFEHAREIGDNIGVDFNMIDIHQFKIGVEMALKLHGARDPQTDVIGNNADLAGKIAWSHLKEIPNFYDLLSKMEQSAGTDEDDYDLL